MGPTVACYIEFIRAIMGINSALLPDNSVYIQWSYQVALATVNKQLKAVCAPRSPYTSIYGLAVYNLAGDRLVNYAQDLPGAEVIEGSNPPMKFFAYMRTTLNLSGFTSGVVQSTGDEATNVSLVVPKAFESLTLSDLQRLKTPWGRQYLELVQDFGPSAWGIS